MPDRPQVPYHYREFSDGSYSFTEYAHSEDAVLAVETSAYRGEDLIRNEVVWGSPGKSTTGMWREDERSQSRVSLFWFLAGYLAFIIIFFLALAWWLAD